MGVRAMVDLEEFRRLIEEEKLTQRRTAELLGVHVRWVERNAKRLGLKTQRTGPRSGEGHPHWGGGRTLRKGYWYQWVGRDHPMAGKNGYVLVHRLVMSAMIGRPLMALEVVHHRNGDPQNNEPENLALFPNNAAHLAHELTGRIPNWTEAGKAALRQAVEKSAIVRQRRASGVGPRNPRSVHF